MLRSRIVILVAWVFLVAFVQNAAAQESPTLSPPATAEESPSDSVTPEQSVLPSPIPEQSSSASPARSVRISFVPPPMEGTISLGIYDKSGKLVRVLHQEAQLNEFAIGADG